MRTPMLVFAAVILASSCTHAAPDNPPVQPEQAMKTAVYSSAKRLVQAVAGRQLRSSEVRTLATAQDINSPDELVKPQLELYKYVNATGFDSDFENTFTLKATSPASGSRNLCYVEYKVNFTQYSPFASGELTTDQTTQAFDESNTGRLQIHDVTVSPDAQLSDKHVDYSLTTGASVSYSAEFGRFNSNQPGTADPTPTADADFGHITQLVSQVTDCITRAFESENQRSSSAPAGPAVNANQMRELGVCTTPCAVTGQFPFQHPAWGACTLVSTLALDTNAWEAHIVVLDAAGKIRWRYDSKEWSELALANNSPDKSGNLFLKFNPGRYDGLVVLRPTRDGIENFSTLPDTASNNPGRFYGAAIAGTDSGGNFQIELDENDCNPDCAGGNHTKHVYVWNGSDYVEK